MIAPGSIEEDSTQGDMVKIKSGEETPYQLLFSPLTIRGLELKNRIVMPAMGTNLCDERGCLTPGALAYYLARAKGGTGLIITEAVAVNLTGKHRAGGLCLFEAFHEDGARQLVEAIHGAGSRVAVQLHHAGRLADPRVTGMEVASASAIPVGPGSPVPRELTSAEIEETIHAFARAAKRSGALGFDAVEIHGAHGYLIHQFLSPRTNQRRDRYGGNAERRARFAVEVAEAVRDALGPKVLLIFRISAREFLAKGYEVGDALALGRRLKDCGVNILNVSGGSTERPESCLHLVQPQAMPEAYLADFANLFRREIGLPVIGVGRIGRPEVAEALLQEEKVDLVAMGRALLADPDFPRKARAGRGRRIRRCIGCNCCLSAVKNQHPITCAVNALTGREAQFSPSRVKGRNKVAVVGAGPSGLSAACTAASMGHRVTLYEKGERIGGQLWEAAAPPHKGLLRTIVSYYGDQLEELGVDVRVQHKVSAKTFQEDEFDVVLVATGSRPILPAIAGLRRETFLYAHEVLLGRIPEGSRVVVIGGGSVGTETSGFLAEQGKKVILIEMLEDIARDVEPMTRILLVQRLQRLDITVMTSCKVLSVSGDEVLVEYDNQQSAIPYDLLVLAVGYESDRQLAEELIKNGMEIVTIGDCNADTPHSIRDSIHQGFWTTLGIFRD